MGTLIRQLITKQFILPGKPINLFNKDNLVIPNSNTDYILATLTYHYGWIAFILVVATIVGFSSLVFKGISRKHLGSLYRFHNAYHFAQCFILSPILDLQVCHPYPYRWSPMATRPPLLTHRYYALSI